MFFTFIVGQQIVFFSFSFFFFFFSFSKWKYGDIMGRIVEKENIYLYFLCSVEVEDVFKLGSMKPGAMLHDAAREFDVGEIFVFCLALFSILGSLDLRIIWF